MIETSASKCRFPILLLHGLFGFVERRVGPVRLEYFRGLVPYLEAAGNLVFTVSVHPVETIEFRSRQIATLIEQHPILSTSHINLVGHSMGGIDGRFLISRLDPERRIVSLSTLASPHRGSWLADIVDTLPFIGKQAASWTPGLRQLSEKHMTLLNSLLPDREDVTYLSIPAATRFLTCTPLMWPLYLLMKFHGGPNDGQVSQASGTWGELVEIAKADHFEVIGLRLGLNSLFPCDHLALYGHLTRLLSERGF